MNDPREAYSALRQARHSAERRWSLHDDRLVTARGLTALAGLGLALAAWKAGVAWSWVAAPVAAFVLLAVVHVGVLRARSRARRAVVHYEDGIARLDGRWAGNGRHGAGYLPDRHLYAADLDLFGPGSLFERINTTRTGAGEAALARWLLNPAPPGAIGERQQAVDELRPRVEFREDLALAGEEIAAGIHPEALRAWAAAPARPFSPALRILAALIGAAGAASLILWLGGYASPVPLLALGVAGLALSLSLRSRIGPIVNGSDHPGAELRILAAVLARVEKETFQSERLRTLRAALDSGGRPPSAAIADLARRLDWMNLRRNQLMAPLAAATLVTMQAAMAVEAWRARHGAAVGRWLDAVGEIEALAAVAAYAFENPQDPWPELAPGPGHFEAEGLGHPLLPAASCVLNDLRLATEALLLLVSGSNMSGKSTLLRSVGVAAVMAQAGFPVRARRLRLSPLAVGATLRIQDSLRDGASRFYAEITRLQEIVRATGGGRPVLFLLDELLAGTNSHDRAAGAEAVLGGLVARGAVGLATTHDLALTRLAEAPALRGANVHFEDRLEEGRLLFDYRLRPGVVTHSNALALMRSVGLEVGEGDPQVAPAGPPV